MPYIPVPFVAEVTVSIQQTSNTELFQQRWHIRNEGGWDGSSIADLAEAAYGFHSNRLLDRLGDDLTVLQMAARDISEEFGPAVTYTPGSPSVGGETAPGAPPNCALVVAFVPLLGPPRRGRTFHPWVAESVVNERGIVDPTFKDGVAADYDLFFDDIELSRAGNLHVIVSRFERNPLPPPALPRSIERDPPVSSPVILYLGRSRVGSQRDRRSTA